MPKRHPDLTFEDHGSIVIMFANSAAGRAWVSEHIPADAPRWGVHGVAIEPRYLEPIIQGAQDDGLWAGLA